MVAETFRYMGAAVLGLTAVLLLRIAWDLFRRGAEDLATLRAYGFGIKAWRKGKLERKESGPANLSTMKGLHVEVDEKGIRYLSKSTVSFDGI